MSKILKITAVAVGAAIIAVFLYFAVIGGR